MPAQRTPLIGSIINRNINPSATATKDQYFLNCFPEVTQNSITGNARAYCVKRAGFAANDLAAAGYIGVLGTRVWSANGTAPLLFGYRNSTTLRIHDVLGTQYGGDLTNTSGNCGISETLISGVPYIVVLTTKTATNRVHAWYVDNLGGAFIEITDVDYPANAGRSTVGNMVHMDGYAFVMDNTARIWNSDLNSLSSWTSTSFIDASDYPDIGVGLARIKNLIVAGGRLSIEFFQNIGNSTGSPLAKVQGATLGIGLYGNFMNVGDQLYFFAFENNSVGFYLIEGTQYKKVSTPAIDKIIDESIASGNGWAVRGAITLYSMDHVIVNDGTYKTLAYCIQTNTWWQFYLANNLVIAACNTTGSGSFLTVSTNTSNQGRKIFSMNPASPTYQDDSSTFAMTVQTAPIDYGTSRKKFFRQFEIVGDTQTTTGNTDIYWTDDDYQTFTGPLSTDMANERKRVSRLGSGRYRGWQITETVNRPFRAESIEITFDVGT